MKEILTRLFGKGSGIVEQVGGVVDKLVRTKEEKAQFEKEMAEILISGSAMPIMSAIEHPSVPSWCVVKGPSRFKAIWRANR